MNTLQIKPNDKGIELHLNGVELEDVKRFSLTSTDMLTAEVTITLEIEHLKGGFTPEEIDTFATEIKKIKTPVFANVPLEEVGKAVERALDNYKASEDHPVNPCWCTKAQIGLDGE